jgi:hypothetical protein
MTECEEKEVVVLSSFGTASFGETVYISRGYSPGPMPIITFVLPGIRCIGNNNEKEKKKKMEKSYIRTDYVPSNIHSSQHSRWISEKIKREEEEIEEKLCCDKFGNQSRLYCRRLF